MRTSTLAGFVVGMAAFLVASSGLAQQQESIAEMVRQLRGARQGGPSSMEQLEAVARSSDPQAVAFMIETLRDPSADPRLRQAAFIHLAGTGGAAGIEAVRQARRPEGARKPWYDSINLARLPVRAIEGLTKENANTWILFNSDVLGNASDLFVAEQQGGKWGRPIFTGAWGGTLYNDDTPKLFRGVPMAKILAGAWLEMFAYDPTIRQDSDGDGLTDVVEARLGTDPQKIDTDGDGLPDAIDPCPNAAPRKLGDVEKIIAACVEARFFSGDVSGPAVVAVDDVKPFEFYGYQSQAIWDTPRQPSPLRRVSGGGVQSVSFESLNDDKAADSPRNKIIRYSADGKTARTIILRFAGGLDADAQEMRLKKIGNEWFVVDFMQRWEA